MKKFLATFMATMMIFSFAGCQSGSDQESAEQAAAEEKGWYSEHYDAEKMKGTTLNMYAVTDSIIPALDAFYEDTGIKVESLTMKNGEMLQRITNEKDSGTVLADLWFTGGADAYIKGAESGLTMPYKSPMVEGLGADMKDEDGNWTGTSLTVVNWIVNIEAIEELGAKVPETWEDLLQPELKGMVSMPDPASSGTAYNTISAILQTRGEEDGWAYLEKLIEQVPFFTPRGSDPVDMTISGEAAVGIAAGTGFAEMEDAPENIKIVYPADGTGWWPQPLAILEGSAHPDEAKVFVDWALSDRGLEEIGKCQRALLVREDVPTVEGLLPLSEINLFPTDFKANAKDRDAILEQWAAKAVK
ncbi:MAG: ABC transporter substrate-binding protein [Clostridia bacterium]|nr:ABC transporter substrate-binding protein [Clostridia bacterium]